MDKGLARDRGAQHGRHEGQARAQEDIDGREDGADAEVSQCKSILSRAEQV